MDRVTYLVLDKEGNLMKRFSSFQEASTYKFVCGNYGWVIKRLEAF